MDEDRITGKYVLPETYSPLFMTGRQGAHTPEEAEKMYRELPRANGAERAAILGKQKKRAK